MSARTPPSLRPVVKAQIPPIELELLQAKVTIVEVHKYETPWSGARYIVSCQVEYGGYRSQLFQLDVKDNEELERKLMVEIAKMKLHVATGYTLPYQRIA